jgi:hypothetical protein
MKMPGYKLYTMMTMLNRSRNDGTVCFNQQARKDGCFYSMAGVTMKKMEGE